ncbi:MAG: hypothetical protein WBG46_04285 [Nonlabens sp.]
MKKHLLNYLLISLFTLTAVKANPNKPISSVAIFEFDNVQSGETLSIKNLENELIYTENVSKSGLYRKRFDLSELENGIYTLILERADKFEFQDFEISGGILISESEKAILYKPTAQLIKDRLYVSQYTTAETKLSIAIYYNGELIHSGSVSGTKTIGRIFKLDKSMKGEYSIVLKSHGETFYRTVTI